MARWFNAFDKPPYNNTEVLSYLLCKLSVEIIMGIHANYFDFGEVKGYGLGSCQD